MNEYSDQFTEPTEAALEVDASKYMRKLQRRCLVFMAFINVGEYLFSLHNIPDPYQSTNFSKLIDFCLPLNSCSHSIRIINNVARQAYLSR